MLKIKGSLENDTLVLAINGRLDSVNTDSVQAKIDEYVASVPVKNMTLDLSGLEYISSAGLRLILKLQKKYQKLRIINASEDVYNVFYITGMTDFLLIDKPAKTSDVPNVEAGSLNDTAWDFEYKSAVDMFTEQVNKDPEKMAVVSTQVSFSYGELNEMSNRIANILRFYNIRPDDTVMILLPRNAMVYAVNLGIMKAGAAFVIANLGYPDDRINFMFKDAGCRHLITTHRIANDRLDLILEIGQRPLFLEHIITAPWYENPNVRIDERDLAYCIYTSGSTGNPKGVMIENGNLSNFLHHNPKNHETMGIVERGTVELAIAPTTFDVSIMEEFIPLTSGMTVAMATEEEIMNPLKMRDFIRKHKVDAMCCTPSYLNSLLSVPQFNDAFVQIRVLDLGAEAFPSALYEKIRAVNPDVLIMNGYGPTEATISCTMKVIDSSENVTIGIPNSNVFCYIVDDNLNELPQGEIGELLVCGKGIGRGYKNLPEKTAQVFVEFRGMKAYRTGDLARITENGEIEYHGRNDSQIKLHGLRIELGEIEENMQKFEKIDACAVLPIENRYLCLYYTVAEPVTKEEVREYAKGHLADYMVPDLYMELKKMPLTANSKIDRKSLPVPDLPKVELKAASTPMQKRILEIVSKVITGVEIGADSVLHDLGMSSLDIIVLLGALGDEYNVALNIRDIADNASVEKLEKMILSKPKIKQREKKDRYPTLTVQAIDYTNWQSENDPSHTLPVMVKLDAAIDTKRLIQALKTTIATHSGVDNCLKADPDGTIWQYPGTDLSGNYDPEIIIVSEKELDDIRQTLSSELMDPEANRFYEFRIYETESNKYLFMRFAHCIADAESISILISDIASAYEGEKLQSETMTMFDLGEELKNMLESPMYGLTYRHYRNLFEGVDKWMCLPEDLSEEALLLGTFEKTLDLSRDEVEAFTKSRKTSPGNFFMALSGFVFAHLAESNSSEFLMVYDGRNDSRLLNTFGFLATLLPLICRIESGKTIEEYLLQIQKQTIENRGHEIFPMQEMMTRYPDMMNYVFIFQTAETPVRIDDQAVEIEWLSENTGSALMKMVLQVIDSGVNYSVRLDYHANRYSKEWIGDLVDRLERTFKKALENSTIQSLKE